LAGSERRTTVLEKRQLRQKILAERSRIPSAYREWASERCVEQVLQVPEVTSAQAVLVYLTYRSELPTEPLIRGFRSQGVTIAVPWLEKRRALFIPALWGEDRDLVEGPYGLLQPREPVAIPPSALDVIVVPAVVFDREGYRIGYGKGYFDRFLSQPGIRGVRVGLAFDLQVVDHLPRDPWDQPVDYIATESSLLNCKRFRVEQGCGSP
jgi:5-formyltetrahydrofolate cyclo-ligase